MKRWMVGAVAALALTAGCDDSDDVFFPGDGPDAPRALDAYYYGGAVYVLWELGPGWDGEPFRVYSKRSSDSSYFLIAEVTNCTGGLCSYTDTNVQAGRSYDYYVAAVDDAGVETATEDAIQVSVPEPVPPPVPSGMEVIALDGANYLRWAANARSEGDFSHYRVYLFLDGDSFFLGETDSEGFLDLLVENGSTYEYFVTSMDDQGHESEGSPAAEGTPRPDYHGEVLFDFFVEPQVSGFVFRASEDENPIVSGSDPSRHFRLETDAAGFWLVPGPGVTVHRFGFETTALKCGVAADASCVALDVAPTSDYAAQDLELIPQTTYVVRVPAGGGQVRYAAVRVDLLGFDQDDTPLVIFDWAYQLQAGNPNLAPRAPSAIRIR
jgi:hypothetical protein